MYFSTLILASLEIRISLQPVVSVPFSQTLYSFNTHLEICISLQLVASVQINQLNDFAIQFASLILPLDTI